MVSGNFILIRSLKQLCGFWKVWFNTAEHKPKRKASGAELPESLHKLHQTMQLTSFGRNFKNLIWSRFDISTRDFSSFNLNQFMESLNDVLIGVKGKAIVDYANYFLYLQ
jgi:hypothetical protein